MSTNSSLAGTGRDYAVIQGRVDSNHGTSGYHLKIQGAGPYVNRGYGLSIVVPVPTELATWMGGIKATISSLANTNALYFAMQAAELDEGKVRVQVAGTKLNRSYGAVFSVANDELASFVEQVLAEAEGDEIQDFDDETEEEEAVVEMI